MILRILASKIKEQLQKFPVIAIVGPRQSGKTTLAKSIAEDYAYYNLEDLSIKRLVAEDPVGFIKNIEKPVIIDEMQKFPDLFSQIQVHVDASNKMGEFIVTGSESLLLSEKVTQSLAGRVATNNLLPLSLVELDLAQKKHSDVKQQILEGFYPRIYNTMQTAQDFYPEYISTYIKKDVRQIQNIGDLSQFEIFLQLLAGRTGQLLNLTSLSNDVGVSHNTLERWISILEASFIAFRLKPYYRSLGKRLKKSPKVYFYDTGLLCNLLSINTSKELFTHNAYGSIFENLVIAEAYKHIYNNKLSTKLYFYRDSNDVEVDLIIENGRGITGVEIKSSSTFSAKFTQSLKKLKEIYSRDFNAGIVIYTGDTLQMTDYKLLNINNLDNFYKLI